MLKLRHILLPTGSRFRKIAGNPYIFYAAIPVTLTILLFIGTIFYLTLPAVQNKLLTSKQESLRELTHIGWDVLYNYEQRVRAGELSRDQAQRLAGRFLSHLRYGPENKNYFWISDMQAKMVMHPYRPDLNGRDLSQFTDPSGKPIFMDFIRIADRKGEGYARYLWQLHDNPAQIVTKLSYVKKFEPWGWIVGTGMYLDDVRAKIDDLTQDILRCLVVILLFIVLMSFIIIRNAYQNEKRRSLAERALSGSEERYRTILKIFQDGYFEVDLSGNMVHCNDAMSHILVYPREKLIGMNNREFMDAETARKVYQGFNEVYRTGRLVKGVDGKLTRQDGTKIWVEVSVALIYDADHQPIGFRGIVRDISRRKTMEQEKEALEKQLRLSRKMESIGTLTGGIAHHFNNILSIILGNTEVALEDLPEGNPAARNLKEIHGATLRARDVIQQLLHFARKSGHQLKPVQMEEVIAEAIGLFRATIPPSIAIRSDIQAPLGTILADPAQMNQVIMNLCTNAFQAVEVKSNGKIVISAANVTLDERLQPVHPDLPQGAYVSLQVRDNGPGIPENIIEHIFDPYFTTRDIDKGTGMGLAVVHGIVKKYGGDIRVKTGIGKGTCFALLLPVLKETESSFSPGSRQLPTGSESILFVDDESLIAQVTWAQLKRLGYRVHAVTDPTEALRVFRQSPKSVDLVITDMAMPQLSGENLVRQMLVIRPDLPVITCTGFHDRKMKSVSKKIGAQGSLMKPYSIKELAEMVRSVLDGKVPLNGGCS